MSRARLVDSQRPCDVGDANSVNGQHAPLTGRVPWHERAFGRRAQDEPIRHHAGSVDSA
jgi:hypothetical protein